MTTRTATRPPTRDLLAELRHTRADRDRLAAMLAELVAADVAADGQGAELRATEHRETYRAGYADGYRRGREDEAHDRDRAWKRVVRPIADATRAETEAKRWELRGQPRTRATFGNPHPADYTPEAAQ